MFLPIVRQLARITSHHVWFRCKHVIHNILVLRKPMKNWRRRRRKKLGERWSKYLQTVDNVLELKICMCFWVYRSLPWVAGPSFLANGTATVTVALDNTVLDCHFGALLSMVFLPIWYILPLIIADTLHIQSRQTLIPIQVGASPKEQDHTVCYVCPCSSSIFHIGHCRSARSSSS